MLQLTPDKIVRKAWQTRGILRCGDDDCVSGDALEEDRFAGRKAIVILGVMVSKVRLLNVHNARQVKWIGLL